MKQFKYYLTFFVLATIAFTISSVPIHAQSASSGIEEVTEELTELPSQIYGDVKDAIGAIAEGIGTTAEYVYPILVKQQIIKSVGYILTLLAVFLVALALLLFGVREGVREDDDFGKGVFYVFSGLITVIGIISFMICSDVIVTGLFNPEYGAIKEIMHLVTGH